MAELRIASGYEFGAASDPGRKRKGSPNQDALDLILPGPRDDFPPLLVLADGMGGHRGGELAGQLVIKAFRETFLYARHPSDNKELLQTCVAEAHRLLVERGRREPELASMGSTVVAALLEPEYLHVISVGDSRVYLVQKQEILQIGEDQSWVAEQVRAGILTAQEARTHPQRNRLSMALSARRSDVKPILADATIGLDDSVILCSDGLWGVLPETLIWAAVRELDPQQAADKLVALANASQGPDNITVIIARHYQPDRQPFRASMDDTNP